MGEGLSSAFAGQSSGERSVLLSRLLIFVNARGLPVFFWGEATAISRPEVLGGNCIYIYRGILGGINKLELIATG